MCQLPSAASAPSGGHAVVSASAMACSETTARLHALHADCVMFQPQGVDGGFTLWKLHCWARTYWHRLAGTALSWFVWDFAFYGNKLFQGTFIAIINPGATLVQASNWSPRVRPMSDCCTLGLGCRHQVGRSCPDIHPLAGTRCSTCLWRTEPALQLVAANILCTAPCPVMYSAQSAETKKDYHGCA